MAAKRFGMLRWGWRLFLLAVFAAGWGLAAAAMHVVVVPGPSDSTEENPWKVLLLPKDRLSFHDTYADTRPWTVADVEGHEALVSRLIEAGHSEHLGHILEPERVRRLDEMLEVRRNVLAED
jgi:hypothetical protein